MLKRGETVPDHEPSITQRIADLEQLRRAIDCELAALRQQRTHDADCRLVVAIAHQFVGYFLVGMLAMALPLSPGEVLKRHRVRC